MFLPLSLTAVLLSALYLQPAKSLEKEWRFIALADWHGAETFVNWPIVEKDELRYHQDAQRKIGVLRHIKEKYGGDLMVLPGDTNSGKWYKDEFLKMLEVKTVEEAVREAGERCYESLKFVFGEAGYSDIVIAVGDHEIGGNPWNTDLVKTGLVQDFRQIFFRSFNREPDGEFRYKTRIGQTAARPKGTIFENTSYARRHKNVLFVTVDAFRQLDSDFKEASKGVGGEGSVTCDVADEHLTWFRNVLRDARNDPEIKHIIVQAHMPIIQPVRKVRCTGQFLDRGENSAFFKAMRDFNVDLYFAGEVHTNTATKDEESNLVQVVSRGNGAQNFLTVDVTENRIVISQYNEIGNESRYNENYELFGMLVIEKGETQTYFSSFGSLNLLDRKQPMIHFSFDEMSTLSERPVLALTHDDYLTTLKQSKITISGTECWDSFPNLGAYDQQYDAQVGDVVLQPGRKGMAAKLNATSQVAVFGIGPHSGGLKVSYALWFKTSQGQRKQPLVHFGDMFVKTDNEKLPFYSLVMEQGVPMLLAGPDMSLLPTDDTLAVADNKWHHLAVSMPKNSCRLSEVQMYLDGKTLSTKVKGKDEYLFFTTSGLVSFGGFGHSSPNIKEKHFKTYQPFEGLIDEAYVWADSLTENKVLSLVNDVDAPKPTGEPDTPLPTTKPTEPPTAAPATPAPTTTLSRPPTPTPTSMPTSKPTTMAPTKSPLVVESNNTQDTNNRGPPPPPPSPPSPTPPTGTASMDKFTDINCKSNSEPTRFTLDADKCEEACLKNTLCFGFRFVRENGLKCRHFTETPEPGAFYEGAICGIKTFT